MNLFKKHWISAPIVGSFSLLLAACTTSSSLNLPALADTAQKAEGTIVWRDLVTTAPDQVKPFYHNVFGWDYQTVNSDYSLITYQGKPIAGMAKMPSNSTTNYWLPVMSTANVDATLVKSTQAGGKTLIKKTTLKGRGDIAVIQDPQGAVFSVLDTVNGDPMPLDKQAGNWVWQEVWTQDVTQSQQFYQSLNSYNKAEKALGDHSYQYLTMGGKPAFGVVKKPNDDITTTWVNYIKVDDVNATVAKVEQNGGVVLMAPNKQVRNGTVAIVRDPAGAGFVIQEIAQEMK
ncbi:VOC family protein [Vibrio gangliei]|uniref:VOC family protein n=1 Tax=Vibrio gangliei TaxID=2077090 RepID=UPI000D018EF1|nr:VOC family protein [Vibrio gangliei]